LDGYSESSYSATPRFAAARLPWFLDQTLSALQIIGVLLVIGSIWLGQRSNRTPRARIACRKSP
ncbi:hypothetical protein OWW41_005075, partial [Escherichia coli]|nr:hypothetical protein [Escherichia coli]ELK7480106.1 hypothetical protein [Escherichia coli]EMB0257530.1 hypothetical protein [Escherichia coli]